MRYQKPILIVAGLVVIAVLTLISLNTIDRRLAGDGTTVEGGPPDHELAGAVGGPFSLIDGDGKPVTEKSWPGKYLLVFFGFTFCPDVCPTTLADMSETLRLLGPAADRIQPLFVTVDPERDGAAEMKEYTSSFDPRITGLTGSRAQIDAVLKTYRVVAVRRGEGDDYTMDHSALLYLMGPDGHLKQVYAHDMEPKAMADSLRDLVGG
ncbi:SCO family protein [Zavarzinia compransoris]|uniref:SCO family protein n=1 Tax=Zavarzinia marina TaxID=2911065 RepID=UPI001F1D6A78|nr:SCO family protein [Zavarzinia marina]MCF4166071.1 SCO family protein [Zavarzinia marina]